MATRKKIVYDERGIGRQVEQEVNMSQGMPYREAGILRLNGVNPDDPKSVEMANAAVAPVRGYQISEQQARSTLPVIEPSGSPGGNKEFITRFDLNAPQVAPTASRPRPAQQAQQAQPQQQQAPSAIPAAPRARGGGDLVKMDRGMPVFARGAQNPQEQIAMLDAGNPAAENLKTWGRYVSDRSASRSGSVDRGLGATRQFREAVRPEAGAGEARMAMAIALAGADQTISGQQAGVPSQFKQGGSADQDFNRFAPIWAGDAKGRAMIQDYAKRADIRRTEIAERKATLDPAKYSSIDDYVKDIVGEGDRLTGAFANRVASASITDEERKVIGINSQVKTLQEAADKDAKALGTVAPKYVVVGNKIEVSNPGEVTNSDMIRNRRLAEEQAAMTGGSVSMTIGEGGRATFSVTPGRATEREQASQALRSFISGDLARAYEVAPMSSALDKSKSLSEEFDIKDPEKGSVSVDISEQQGATIASLVDATSKALISGTTTASDFGSLFDESVNQLAEQQGVNRETIIKRLGTTETGLRDSMTEFSRRLYQGLQTEEGRRAQEADRMGTQLINTLTRTMSSAGAAAFISSQLSTLQTTAGQANIVAREVFTQIEQAQSPSALAYALSAHYKAQGSTGSAMQDAAIGKLVNTLDAIAALDPAAMSANPELMNSLSAGAQKYSKVLREDRDVAMSLASPSVAMGYGSGEFSFDKETKSFMPAGVYLDYSAMSAEAKKAFSTLVPSNPGELLIGRSITMPTVRGVDDRIVKQDFETATVSAAMAGDIRYIADPGRVKSQLNPWTQKSAAMMSTASAEVSSVPAKERSAKLVEQAPWAQKYMDAAVNIALQSDDPRVVQGAVAKVYALRYNELETEMSAGISTSMVRFVDQMENLGIAPVGASAQFKDMAVGGFTIQEARQVKKYVMDQVSGMTDQQKEQLRARYDEYTAIGAGIRQAFQTATDVQESVTDPMRRAKAAKEQMDVMGALPFGARDQQPVNEALSIYKDFESLINVAIRPFEMGSEFPAGATTALM